VGLNVLFIVFGMGVAVLLALILSEIRRTSVKRLFQSGIFLPYFVSWIVVQQMVYALLGSEHGLLTNLLMRLTGERVNFYASPHLWRGILTCIYVLKMSGYYAVIFIGAVTAIDPTYYESAVIDGASRLQMAMRITLPLIKKAVMVMTLLAVGRIFYGDVGMIYGLIGDNSLLYATTDVIDTYAYRALRRLNNFSMASAVAVYQSLMGVVTILFFNFVARKVDEGARLF
jgi:putative aldouronate transport system permease protein